MAWMEKIMVSRHGNAMSKDIFKANIVGQKVTTKGIQKKVYFNNLIVKSKD